MVVIELSRRVVVQASSLRAMRVKSCHYSRPSIQHLHVFPHIWSLSLCKNLGPPMSLSLFKILYLCIWIYASLFLEKFLSFLFWERKNKKKKVKDKEKKGSTGKEKRVERFVRRRPKCESPLTGREKLLKRRRLVCFVRKWEPICFVYIAGFCLSFAVLSFHVRSFHFPHSFNIMF